MAVFTEEQKAERRLGIGGSEVSALFGLSPYRDLTPLTLYFEKRGEIDRSIEENEAMFWGQVLEEPICNVWAERTGSKIRRVPGIRWMNKKDKETFPLFVSLDRQIIENPRGPGALEAKNFGYWHGRDIHTLDDVPPFVRIQQMHGMAVTGYQWGAIAILVGGNKLLSWEIERDEEACQQIIETCYEFMQKCKQGIPPAVDANSDYVLGLAFKKGGAPAISCVDPQVQRVAMELLTYKAQCKQMEDEWEKRKNFMKLYMGNAEELLVPGVGEFFWKKGKDKKELVFNEERFRQEHPDLYAKYQETRVKSASRTFRDKPAGNE